MPGQGGVKVYMLNLLFLVSNLGFGAILFFFLLCFCGKCMLVYLREALILESGLGFLRGLGEHFRAFGFFFFFSCCSWQPRDNAGFLRDWDGPMAESGPVLRQRSAFSLRARRTSREYPLFRADFAELLSEPPAPWLGAGSSGGSGALPPPGRAPWL